MYAALDQLHFIFYLQNIVFSFSTSSRISHSLSLLLLSLPSISPPLSLSPYFFLLLPSLPSPSLCPPFLSLSIPSSIHLSPFLSFSLSLPSLHPRLRGGAKIALLLLSLFGFFTFDVVYMFSIMNYVIQGELNIYLLWDIQKLIELRKHDDFDGAIKVCCVV